MSKGILFFDIDGTVADWDYIPRSAAEALRKAKENGYIRIVNTGRTWASINQEVREQDFDGYICGCGNHIYFRGETLLSRSISASRCREIVELLGKRRIPAFFEAEEQIYFDSASCGRDPWLEQQKKNFGIRGLGREIREVEEYVFDKFLVFPPDRETEIFLEKEFERDLHCFHSGNGVWEVIQKEYSKATGIRFLCEYLKVRPEDCCAFGDSVNDVDMFQAVGRSAAMGNGDERIFPYAGHRTLPLREDGLARAMEHFGII